jgi:hypothetical protein
MLSNTVLLRLEAVSRMTTTSTSAQVNEVAAGRAVKQTIKHNANVALDDMLATV